MNDEILKYPIGVFAEPALYTEALCTGWIDDIRNFPVKLDLSLSNMTAEQLELSYRPGSWTGRQIVHHIDTRKKYFRQFKMP